MPQVDGGLSGLLESFEEDEMRSLMLQAAAVQVSAWGAVRPMSTEHCEHFWYFWRGTGRIHRCLFSDLFAMDSVVHI